MSSLFVWIFVLLYGGGVAEAINTQQRSNITAMSSQLKDLVKYLQIKNLALSEELSWWDTEMIKLEEEILELRHSHQNLLKSSRKEHGRR
ncbi:hypothetical protein Pmani_014998 [Petrolisthes manimaculis]|uniref:Uncharacterized protein n=1 Tax=Petrolisthes manimaculis TaxID=1843537 RepID=A0AAE1PRT1_9EUCA|nr:hypothetical protein Pmani_014998 [Petrolisthes manimaculis]